MKVPLSNRRNWTAVTHGDSGTAVKVKSRPISAGTTKPVVLSLMSSPWPSGWEGSFVLTRRKPARAGVASLHSCLAGTPSPLSVKMASSKSSSDTKSSGISDTPFADTTVSISGGTSSLKLIVIFRLPPPPVSLMLTPTIGALPSPGGVGSISAHSSSHTAEPTSPSNTRAVSDSMAEVALRRREGECACKKRKERESRDS
mmetsp:Transcript_2951/g.6707  ORF Transcript_2951/g.6707 Transcript_2951/m.6707 type:complete len:201 (-) Transcript_2951:38-640(-)